MDSGLSENAPRVLRRSKRHSSVLNVKPTPRNPIRSKKGLKNQAPAAVNGSRDTEDDSEDDESPKKKSRMETGGDVGGSGVEMDVQDSEPENEEDQAMETEGESSHDIEQPKICRGARGDGNLPLPVDHGEHFQSSAAVIKRGAHGDGNLPLPVDHGERFQSSAAVIKRVKPSTKGPAASTKSDIQSRPAVTRLKVSNSKVSVGIKSASSSCIPPVNHLVRSGYLAPGESYIPAQPLNNIPTRKETSQHKKQGVNTAAGIKRNSGHSSRGFMWCFPRLVFLVMLSASAVLVIPVLQRAADDGEISVRAVKPERFADHLSLLETQFPSQRPEVWKRSKIHLENHLKAEQPTEPVSLIFTAGHRAERTLHCLAQGLASSFSSALNGSVLHIDGARKASQDSDDVKIDIDLQLQAAFEGDKPAAVIHRFEELPPGSTLIFYRYCDHETAAYKRVFLLFTVLLTEDEVSSKLSLKEVEEMVHDYVKEKLVASSKQTAFNVMDTDKYGGLWSRISHLVLPVVSESEVEQNGCPTMTPS